MFCASWTKTLRELRVAILGWGLGLGLSPYANYATAKDAIAAGINGLPSGPVHGRAVAVGTVPGYVTFRLLGLVLPVLPLVRRDLDGVAPAGLGAVQLRRADLPARLPPP